MLKNLGSKIIGSNVTIKRHLNIPVYKGPFEEKRTNNFSRKGGISDQGFESVYKQIKDLQDAVIVKPSPLHLVWRYKKFESSPWHEMVVLRKIGLNGRDMNEKVIIPNTPHFNKLLWQVKHLLRLKPISFPDGVPTEDDIGAIKVNIYTGEMKINEDFRPTEYSLYGYQTPEIYKGKYLTKYLQKMSGLFNL